MCNIVIFLCIFNSTHVVTLLNMEYYDAVMKPLVAKWVYIWLEKQHLFGIDQNEAISYMLEGAAARSDIATKIELIEAALTKAQIAAGDISEEPEMTPGHEGTMSTDQLQGRKTRIALVKQQTKLRVNNSPQLSSLLLAQIKFLQEAKSISQSHRTMVSTF